MAERHLLKDKKICGILIENDLSGHHIRRSIAGIGININQEVFNSDAPNPVSLKQITGKEHDRYEILLPIPKTCTNLLQQPPNGGFAVYSDDISTRYARPFSVAGDCTFMKMPTASSLPGCCV